MKNINNVFVFEDLLGIGILKSESESEVSCTECGSDHTACLARIWHNGETIYSNPPDIIEYFCRRCGNRFTSPTIH